MTKTRPPHLRSTKEIAAHCDTTESYLRTLRSRGRGPRWQRLPNDNHRVYYDLREVDAWLRGERRA